MEVDVKSEVISRHLAVLRGQEARESGDHKAVVQLKLEFTVELLRLMQ